MSKLADETNIHLATETPRVKEMIAELHRAVGEAAEYYDRCEHALDVREAWWPGQARDGRKHGMPGTPPFPWENASDTRVRKVDMVINEYVELLVTSLARMNVQVTPTKAGDMDTSERMATLLRWYLANAMGDELDAEVEPLANYVLTFGSGVLAVHWLETLAYELRTVRLEDLLAAAQASGGPQFVTELALMLMDPARFETVKEYVLQFSELLSEREAAKVVRDLQRNVETTFAQSYVDQSRPSIRALQTFQDVFFPVETARLQEARWVAQRVLLTETQLREKAAGPEGWDEEFVEAVLKQEGKMLNLGEASGRIGAWREERGYGVSGAAGVPELKMFEVWYFYTRASHKSGLPAIWCTVFHAQVPDLWAKHEICPYEHGKFPYVEFTRERRVPQILESRGLPELIATHQQEIKTQRDARVDRASLTTVPPMKELLRNGDRKLTIGPAVRIPVKAHTDLEPLVLPPPDMLSVEVERATTHDLNEYVGRAGEGVDPQLVADRKQAYMGRWLRRWKEVGMQMLQLAQQYTQEFTLPRVAGLVAKPMQISREEIAGQFDLMLSFDARFANMEFVFKIVENLNKFVLPLDVNARVDRDAVLEWVMKGIDPTLADIAIRDAQTAQADEVEDEQAQLVKMALGLEPPMKLGGQNYGARLQVLQQGLATSPQLQAQLAQNPVFQQMLERRVEFFTQQLNQEKNKVIGMYGTTPSPGSAGAPMGVPPSQGYGAPGPLLGAVGQS